jgi:TRAP-type mannitol/chloroaromatic compound transport system permease large subunit
LDPITVGIIGTLALFLLLFVGMPIAFAMMLVGFLGIAYLSSFGAALPVLAHTVYGVSADYSYTVIPLFIIMGGFAGSSGMTGELYSTFDKWLSRLPGGLGIATIGACAGFAAVSGSSVATAATMGTVALPEMKRYNYDPSTGHRLRGRRRHPGFSDPAQYRIYRLRHADRTVHRQAAGGGHGAGNCSGHFIYRGGHCDG